MSIMRGNIFAVVWLGLAMSIAMPSTSARSDESSAPRDYRDLNQFYAKKHAKNWYPEIKKISMDIMKRYPSSEYVYLGIGRSPTPLISFMQQVDMKSAFNIPLSRSSQKIESKLLAKRVTELFDRFVENEGILKTGKKILLIDFVNRGESIQQANHFLNSYLELKSAKNKVTVLALVDQSRQSRITELKKTEKWKNTDPFLLSDKEYGSFYSSQYDAWSQYGSLDITKNKVSISSIKNREEYEMLSREIHKEMLQDGSAEMSALVGKSKNHCSTMLNIILQAMK